MAWKQISLHTDGWFTVGLGGKQGRTVSLRSEPVIRSDTFVTSIPARTSKVTQGLINTKYTYGDGTYNWYPVYLPELKNIIHCWVAIEVVDYTLGEEIPYEERQTDSTIRFYEFPEYVGSPTMGYTDYEKEQVALHLEYLGKYLLTKQPTGSVEIEKENG